MINYNSKEWKSALKSNAGRLPDGIYLGVPFEIYNTDPDDVFGPRLRSTWAKTAALESAAHAEAARGSASGRAAEIGRAIHAALEGDPWEIVDAPNPMDFRSKAGKAAARGWAKDKLPESAHQAADELNNQGELRTLLSEHRILMREDKDRPSEGERAVCATESVKNNAAFQTWQERQRVAMEATLLFDYHGTPAMARLDGMGAAEEGEDIDFKSIESVTRAYWTIRDRAWYVQAALYNHGAEQLLGKGREFTWYAIERNPPYSVSIWRPSARAMEAGHIALRRAADLWEDLQRRGEPLGTLEECNIWDPPRNLFDRIQNGPGKEPDDPFGF